VDDFRIFCAGATDLVLAVIGRRFARTRLASVDALKICDMTVFKQSIQERTLSLRATIRMADRREGPRADVAEATPRAGTFARPAIASKGSDGNALCDA
jgi:hypothetical protein